MDADMAWDTYECNIYYVRCTVYQLQYLVINVLIYF